MPPDNATGLLGRDQELRELEILIGNARNGRGGSTLLLGDPGIGKTMLLDTATARLTGVQLIRVDGYEAESTMPFAAAQRLIRPLRDHLPALPERHRQALLVAAGETDGPPPDRFLVGLGVLGLLGAAGDTVPVVCAIDDAHHLDAESLDVFAFVARRLEAESATLLLAGRDSPALTNQAAGIPARHLTGLPQDAAVRLLMRTLPERIDPAVAVQVFAATAGNPLALVDLAGELTVRQLTESSFGDEPLPVGRRLEQHYLRQVRKLGAEAQLWLLIAAADATGNLDLITAVAGDLGLPADVADTAETAGLVELGRSVLFRHPLVRGAAYNAAFGKDRRRVHRALSVRADELNLVEHAAWHAAKATLGTDEQVAQRLERVADLAAERGGFASRARVLMEAATLTPAGGVRYARLVRAAEAALAAGTSQLAKDLIDEIDEGLLDPVSRGRLTVIGADYAMFVAAPTLTRASADTLEAARHFHGHDTDLEQAALIKAWEWALSPERLTAGIEWPELGRRFAEGAALKEGDPAVILRAISALILKPYPDAVPAIRAALDLYERMDPASMLNYGHGVAALATAVWDAEARHRLLEKFAAAARDTGSLQKLDSALWVLSLSEALGGTPRQALKYMEQVRELRRAIGYDAEHVVNVATLAWSEAARPQVLAMAEATYAMGFGGVHSTAMAALATVDIAEGRYAEAYQKLKPFVDDPFFHVTPVTWPDFAEAAAHCGFTAEAFTTAAQLTELAAASGSRWARGVAHRVQAVVHGNEQDFLDAIADLDGAYAAIDEGRAHLAYGEWLRRAKRRRDARPHLRKAADLFERAGADPFTVRATRELEAAGETRQESVPGRPAQLTPQELTVAELAAAGRTNAEIGATIFLSVNTVDYHLRKVFQKLGISSRRQLSDRLDHV
ncbi:DNA-binding CsgD family transcriptional regulator [Actinoplanes lutulentus]|uniref:Regulatory LuxR family protein n=1 Tax=Actinoplanes lutulentus TaxID=1287878 RepID=A0A327Z3K9_9ACTN|nr:LuxR family transcriptional regulator [Actinoplanes lutulentus]MBB2948893.1 DNA-binding CsgD family transcriptional regulator [Actinoplanes lutulentus]RAK29803.1 regulatory LuxR family protein [Actinoplanes lutulentus]